MSVSASIPFPAVWYVVSCNQDAQFGGAFWDVDVAMQECQGVAVGGLHWTQSDPGQWEATDPVTLAVYEIDARPC